MEMVRSSHISKEEDGIMGIIAQDDKDEFKSFLQYSSVLNSGDLVKLKFGESEFCPYKLLGWICKYRAVHCGTALVEDNRSLIVDLNLPLNGGATPLHEAAASLSAGLVELFLRHGAEADVRCSDADLEKNGVLPLHLAVERVSFTIKLSRWTPKQSVFKLIVMLCLPKMKEALETIRLLAQETKEIKEVIRHYTKEAKLIELAVLMMVAQEKFLEPIAPQSEPELFSATLRAALPTTWFSEGVIPQSEVDHTSEPSLMTFRQCIKIELGAHIEYEFGIMGKKKEKKLLLEIRKRKAIMISILLLLEIFERAGASIEAYLLSERTIVPNEQVAQELAMLLGEAGYILKSKDKDLRDMVDSCPIKPMLEHSDDPICAQDEKSEKPSELGSLRQDAQTPSNLQFGSFSDKNPLCGVQLIPTRFPHRSSVSSFALRPFHPSWMPKACFCSGFSGKMKVQVKERSTGIEHSVWNFPSSKRWFSFALAVKRVIRVR